MHQHWGRDVTLRKRQYAPLCTTVSLLPVSYGAQAVS